MIMAHHTRARGPASIDAACVPSLSRMHVMGHDVNAKSRTENHVSKTLAGTLQKQRNFYSARPVNQIADVRCAPTPPRRAGGIRVDSAHDPKARGANVAWYVERPRDKLRSNETYCNEWNYRARRRTPSRPCTDLRTTAPRDQCIASIYIGYSVHGTEYTSNVEAGTWNDLDQKSNTRARREHFYL